MRRALWVAGATVALVAGATVGTEPVLQLSILGQGITPVNAPDVGRVYIIREGSVVYAASATSIAGARIVWCPYEELFWAPDSLAVYSRSGQVAYGGRRDPREGMPPSSDGMRFYRVTVDTEQRVRIWPSGNGERPPMRIVPRDVVSFYDRWLNRANTPTQKELRWCPSPVR